MLVKPLSDKEKCLHLSLNQIPSLLVLILQPLLSGPCCPHPSPLYGEGAHLKWLEILSLSWLAFSQWLPTLGVSGWLAFRWAA